MRYIVKLLLLFLLGGCFTQQTADKTRISGINYCEYDLSSDDYTLECIVAKNGTMPFEKLIEEHKPLCAVTGTYYDENMKPCGDIVSGGELINRGYHRWGVGVTKDNKIRFIKRKDAKFDWSGFDFAISCGPKLVSDGKRDVAPIRDGFGKNALTLEAPRTAIGARGDSVLVLCSVKRGVTLDELANIMLRLGCDEALNLDGGSMCAFYGDNRFFDSPIGGVNNAILVKNKRIF